MILLDLNQTMISNMMMALGPHKNVDVDVSMLRHMVLNSLRSYRNKYKNKYGELVICSDDKNYWRREAFPYYKALRKKARADDELDWQNIFDSMNLIRLELKEFFPYKNIHVDQVEADDIIGTLCHEFGAQLNTGEPILILSGDKDFIQLHKFLNVSQYSPVQNTWVKHSDPVKYLEEHIIKGDRGDGIPNIYSDDNCLVIGKRQTPVTAKRLVEATDINSLDDEKLKAQLNRNYIRNKQLIDLGEVPQKYKDEIMRQFNTNPEGDRSHLFTYFMKNKLKNLMGQINEF